MGVSEPPDRGGNQPPPDDDMSWVKTHSDRFLYECEQLNSYVKASGHRPTESDLAVMITYAAKAFKEQYFVNERLYEELLAKRAREAGQEPPVTPHIELVFKWHEVFKTLDEYFADPQLHKVKTVFVTVNSVFMEMFKANDAFRGDLGWEKRVD